MKISSSILRFSLLSLACLALVSCATTGGNNRKLDSGRVRMSADQIREARQQRDVDIAAEPVGDFWIGRRWHTKGTRFWGYLRRPGQPWSQARLIMLNESQKLAPDRLPEAPASGNAAGFDHNYEYQMWGHFSGDTVYDPNSNLMLPEFKLTRYEMINAKPGYVFEPWERYWSNTFPPLTPRTRHLRR